MMLDLCLACSGSPLPAEKPAQRHRTACCDRAICDACLSRRPRLARYCLNCQRAIDVATSSTSSTPPDFVLGEDDGDDDDLLDEKLGLFDEPPAYSAEPEKVRIEDEKRGDEEKPPHLPIPDEPTSRLYYIAPDDTLVGISFAHGVTPRCLASLNGLPSAVLTSQPTLLHTRQFLVLPPHARVSTSPRPLIDPESERRRLLLRRFQIAAKIPDADEAQVYLDAVWEDRERERTMMVENRRRRRTTAVPAGDLDADDLPIRTGGEVEDALQKWSEDRRWEENERRAGRRPHVTVKRCS